MSLAPEQPSDKELLALAQLRENLHFQNFMEWIERWAKQEVNECVTAEKPGLHQGRAQVLLAIGENYDKAAEHYRGRAVRRATQAANPDNAF